MGQLGIHREGAIVTLRLEREPQRNSLNAPLIDALIRALDELEQDPTTRVIVVTGAGERAFCAGGDLTGGGDERAVAQHDVRRRYGALLERMMSVEKPVIARVNGHALAGGLGLVCAADLAVAVEEAEFGTPEVNVGLFPYMVTALLFRELPRKHAMRLVLTGERIDAQTAQTLGLVNEVVPRSSLDERTAALAHALASKSPLVLGLGKRALRTAQDLPLAQAMEHLASQLTVNTLADDAAEGVSAFLEKRPPQWSGH